MPAPDLPFARTGVETFVLERPRIRRRRRRRDRRTQESLGGDALPYFIVGRNNAVPHYLATSDYLVSAAGGAMVGGPIDAKILRGDPAGPILLIGPTGVGKTALAMHLAARFGIAIAERTMADGPAETVYIPASDFARDYVEAIEVDDLATLQRRLIDAAVLIVDDIDQIETRTSAQDELARRIEDRAAAGTPTILSARRTPDLIAGVTPMLATRAMGGWCVPLHHVDREATIRMVAEYALHYGIELDPPWIDALADAVSVDVAGEVTARMIESLMQSIRLRMRMEDCDADLDLLQRVIDQTTFRRDVSMAEIARQTARMFGLPTAELKGPSRRTSIVRARSVAMWLSRELAGESTHRIGEHFGGRDHTTVMHALAKIDDALGNDATLDQSITELKEQLLG